MDPCLCMQAGISDRGLEVTLEDFAFDDGVWVGVGADSEESYLVGAFVERLVDAGHV